MSAGGADRNRTDDICLAKAALCQLSYGPGRPGAYRSHGPPPSGPPAAARHRPTGTPVTSRAAVAAGHPATLAAAVEVLGRGGNAFDAAVAAGFAAAVAEPVLSSLGGGGFLLARTAAGEEVCFDFFVDVPGRGAPPGRVPEMTSVTLAFGAADQVFHVGHGSVAVPGCLPGYLHVHRRLGRLPLEEVVAPARGLAEHGVVLGPDQAAVARLVDPILSLTAVGRARFHPDGAPLGDEARVADPALAALYADIGAGRITGFDDPDLAADIEAASRAGGGVLTAADLTAYRVHEREPLRHTYRGATLVSNPPPSSGATLIGRALEVLAEGAPLRAHEPDRLVRVADALAAMTRPPRPGPTAVRGTTQVSITDAAGNLASMTTSNGSGSGVHLGATGVLANNVMGEEDLVAPDQPLVPGTRIGSMMAPGLLDRPGHGTVVFGSGGSERIRSAMTQVVVRLIDEDVDLATAVTAPRIHLDTAGVVQVEPAHPDAAVEQLRAARRTNVWGVTDLYFGGVHAVTTDGEHVGDPRRGGTSQRL